MSICARVCATLWGAMDLDDEAEAIAAEASAESGLDDRPHCDPLVLAVCYLGLRLVPRRGRGSRLVEDRILYPASASEHDAAYFVAHECGHALVRLARLRLSHELEERAASRVGCALLLPRRSFARDVRATAGDVRSLAALWCLATPTIIRRRMAEVSRAE